MQDIHILSISELTQLIKFQLEQGFDYLWVEGEISNFRMPSSGHFYFTLKDEKSQIRAVMFRSQNRTLEFAPEDGLSVICRGRLNVYETRGEYQLILDYLEPKGRGALQLAFEQLKQRLAQEGLFDPDHKKPLPQLPRKIGIVTSPTGAAIRDILNIIERRFANVGILIYPVKVQGEGAAQEIASALDELNRTPGIDVIILTRGGGSIEDLWPFNEEVVARAIYHSEIPVISAVGHEVDFTIADFVASLRAPTPSAAAELVVRNKDDLIYNLNTVYVRLKNSIRKIYEFNQSRFAFLQKRMPDPRKMIPGLRLTIDEYGERIAFYVSNAVKIKKEKIEGMMGRLDALSPLNVLKRGYSITRTVPDLKVVRNAKQLASGDKINVRLFKGELMCRVEEVKI
ncbi:MAG: exodeoxyribonuclease VII large subunit [Proteobacteria bacterium]|nr:exodeoxyribonuclease VII large subunit [Pseudomonadota bacterium]